jgi:hypothetical protein
MIVPALRELGQILASRKRDDPGGERVRIARELFRFEHPPPCLTAQPKSSAKENYPF